jgi:hypothetical protein
MYDEKLGIVAVVCLEIPQHHDTNAEQSVA